MQGSWPCLVMSSQVPQLHLPDKGMSSIALCKYLTLMGGYTGQPSVFGLGIFWTLDYVDQCFKGTPFQ